MHTRNVVAIRGKSISCCHDVVLQEHHGNSWELELERLAMNVFVVVRIGRVGDNPRVPKVDPTKPFVVGLEEDFEPRNSRHHSSLVKMTRVAVNNSNHVADLDEVAALVSVTHEASTDAGRGGFHCQFVAANIEIMSNVVRFKIELTFQTTMVLIFVLCLVCVGCVCVCKQETTR